MLSKQADAEYKKLLRHKWEYYSGKSEKPFELKVLRQDIPTYLESDEDMIKLEQKVTYVQSVVDYLDRTVKIISNRGFQIKNAIDWRKFTSGVI